MIFIIGILIGIVGISTILFVASASRRHRTHPAIQPGDEWFSYSITHIESSVENALRQGLRLVLKNILVWMVDVYRSITRKITIKEIAKKKIRQFLSDQKTHTHHSPSVFWKKVTQKAPENSSDML